MLFGRNIENLNDEISYNCACMGHAICVEGGIALAILTAAFHGIIEPGTVALLAEGLFCTWWMCSVYTGMPRQTLQRKYHLKVFFPFPFLFSAILITKTYSIKVNYTLFLSLSVSSVGFTV